MTILSRISDYLGNGGFFNPECMEHDKVRELIMDIREQLRPRPEYSAPFNVQVLAFQDGEWETCRRLRNEAGLVWWMTDDRQYYKKPTHWLPMPPAPTTGRPC